jgi:hypothetical protein
MNNFWVGFLAGVVAAGILGFALQQIRLLQKSWKAMSQPQSVQVKTSKTPMQVVASGLQVGCVIIVMLILLGVVLWLVLGSPV